jgi:hypothetical protein
MHGPFGMTATEAAAIARAVTPVATRKYADAVLASGLEWLQTLAAADMDAIPASRAHLQHVPAAHKTESYLAEVEGMYDYPVWRIISGPCFGHPRKHGGELRTVLAMTRASWLSIRCDSRRRGWVSGTAKDGWLPRRPAES